MGALVRLLINALVLWGVAYILPGIVITDFYTALISAAVLILLNLLFKPILQFLTLPINIITLGLFTFIINGFLFWLTARFIGGFVIQGFWWAVGGALIFSIASYALNDFFKED